MLISHNHNTLLEENINILVSDVNELCRLGLFLSNALYFIDIPCFYFIPSLKLDISNIEHKIIYLMPIINRWLFVDIEILFFPCSSLPEIFQGDVFNTQIYLVVDKGIYWYFFKMGYIGVNSVWTKGSTLRFTIDIVVIVSSTCIVAHLIQSSLYI